MKREAMVAAGLLLVGIGAFVALRDTTPPPPPPEEDLSGLTDDEIAERTIAYMHEMVAEGQPHIGDCEALADALEQVQARHRGLLAILETYRADPAKRRWFDENYGHRVKEDGMWMTDVVRPRCQKNERIAKIMGG